MEVPACGLRGQTGNARYSTYLEHVVHILVPAIVWPCWICYAFIMQLVCMYIDSTGLDIGSHVGQALRSPETLDIWPHSSWKNFLSENRRQV